ncbi:hypothetical protein CYLTODRAFT_416559 [Cylindrobasidium torrendii FP15055 ss-10]|uniref:Uncharacterized protein n=1 Tax=Cylindrobasidium torrendii FP15055 ss-10 TaxID=1314674 RepID=A0A0D7BW91_9AGAR|nr:hypothetical protein CYLTODRAFT_416559 [Cylindrobasidium torrendii FP15055 ss-10]
MSGHYPGISKLFLAISQWRGNGVSRTLTRTMPGQGKNKLRNPLVLSNTLPCSISRFIVGTPSCKAPTAEDSGTHTSRWRYTSQSDAPSATGASQCGTGTFLLAPPPPALSSPSAQRARRNSESTSFTRKPKPRRRDAIRRSSTLPTPPAFNDTHSSTSSTVLSRPSPPSYTVNGSDAYSPNVVLSPRLPSQGAVPYDYTAYQTQGDPSYFAAGTYRQAYAHRQQPHTFEEYTQPDFASMPRTLSFPTHEGSQYGAPYEPQPLDMPPPLPTVSTHQNALHLSFDGLPQLWGEQPYMPTHSLEEYPLDMYAQYRETTSLAQAAAQMSSGNRPSRIPPAWFGGHNSSGYGQHAAPYPASSWDVPAADGYPYAGGTAVYNENMSHVGSIMHGENNYAVNAEMCEYPDLFERDPGDEADAR